MEQLLALRLLAVVCPRVGNVRRWLLVVVAVGAMPSVVPWLALSAVRVLVPRRRRLCQWVSRPVVVVPTVSLPYLQVAGDVKGPRPHV